MGIIRAFQFNIPNTSIRRNVMIALFSILDWTPVYFCLLNADNLRVVKPRCSLFFFNRELAFLVIFDAITH